MSKSTSLFGVVLGSLVMANLLTQAQPYTLTSDVTYSGRQSGDVWVVASPFKTMPPITTYATILEVPTDAPFSQVQAAITNVVGEFYLFAWRDSIANGVPDPTEAQGWHPEQPIKVNSDRTVTGFVIGDPDADFDALPDWWETQYGLNLQVGDGSDGVLTVIAGEHFTDSVWANVVGANPVGSSLLNVSRTEGFNPDDLVMIITSQDPNPVATRNRAGTYEFGRIASLSSNALLLTQPLAHAFMATTSEKTQVLKVPEYSDVYLNLNAGALEFDGVDDHLDLPDGVYFNGDFTVEAWVKIRAYATWCRLLDFGNGPANNNVICVLSKESTGKPMLSIYRSGATRTEFEAPNSLPLDEWVHLAYSLSNTVGRILVNGAEVARMSGMNIPADVTRVNNYFGRGAWAGDAYAPATFDEVRIWNRVRTEPEIRADMTRRLSGDEPGLTVYLRLDEGTGQTAYDATDNSIDATLVNGPVWSPPPPAILTCQPWDGTRGGVLALLSRQIHLGSNSLISADGKGYRGGTGAPSAGDYQFGVAGERTTGFSTTRETDSLQRPQGGGGAGKGADGSGGGGGYGENGADGAKTLDNSDYGRGAASFGSSFLSRLYPGGGGGGSGSHSHGEIGVGGGAGGGILFVAAAGLEGNGSLSSRGAQGTPGQYVYNDNSGSGGGGGAGGSVYLIGDIADSIQVLATGGAGGPRDIRSARSKDGGAGGAGRVRMDLPPDTPVPVSDPPAGYVIQSSSQLSPHWSDEDDSDHDGLSDWREYSLNTNPVHTDTDGDTLPDKWETDHGLDPSDPQDAAADQDDDGDGVANQLEFHRGTHPKLADTDGDGLNDGDELFVHRTDPLQADTDSDGVTDSAEVAAGTDPRLSGTRYFHDALDRLVGVQYENGLGLGYAYDGNHNLLRQVYTQRDANSNNLPDLWEFMNGLTNNTSGFVDTDGDGWSDFEEWEATTHPGNADSLPNVLGDAGTSVASLALPFTPSNFVVGAGQLDGIGAEEIVIGADGNPGTTTNFLLVLSQTESGWTSERVDIGSLGVTSIAVGQAANRPTAIYLGLRQVGSTGSIAELISDGNEWTLNTIAASQDEEAHVLGVRPGEKVLVSLSADGAPSGGLYFLSFDSTWTQKLASSASSHRGLGTVIPPDAQGTASRGVRLLDSGGLQVIGHDVGLPADAVWNEDYDRWFFLTDEKRTWTYAQAVAQEHTGNLATITDETLGSWLQDHYWESTAADGGYWIGLARQDWNCLGPWQWVSGVPVEYDNWYTGEPNCNGGVEFVVHVRYSDGAWNDVPLTSTLRGVIEVDAAMAVQADEPLVPARLLWRGHSLAGGDLHAAGSHSILYTYVDDRNMNAVMDEGDEFVLAEYKFYGRALNLNTVQRIPLSGSILAQSYGLASVDVLYSDRQTLFTAGPDGRVFSWTATDAAPTLQRQLFSAHHLGKAWHALTGVRTLDPGGNLAGLRVDPASPNRGDLILWSAQQQPSIVTEVPQSAPVTQILPLPNLGRDIAEVNIRIWDAESSVCTPELTYRLEGTLEWSPVTLVAIDGAPISAASSSPSGETHLLAWDAAGDLGPGFTNTVILRARSSDLAMSGVWSPPVDYLVETSLANHPRAFDDSATTDQGRPIDIDILANDTVENGAPKLIASVGNPAHGSVVTNANQTIRYTPALTFVGTDQFIYTLTDGVGGYSVATVTVMVTQGGPVEIVLHSVTVVDGSQFSMTISGAPGQVYEVQTSTNLTTWSEVQSLGNNTGSVLFTEPISDASTNRFYRVILIE